MAYANQDIAKRLWKAQEELMAAAQAISAVIVNDDVLARTLGDDGEYLEANAADLCKTVRAVALRLDRCVAA